MTKRRLGRFETAQTLCGEYAPFNAVGVLHLEKGPPDEVLRLAWEGLRKKHPLLRVRIQKEGRDYFFVPDDSLPLPLSVLQSRDGAAWLEITEEELNRGFDISAGPIFRCRYLHSSGDEPPDVIILTFHHSIVDATSVVNLFHELLSACARLNEGTPPAVTGPLPLLGPEESYFPRAYRGWSGRWRTLSYLARQLRDEIGYRKDVRGRRRPPIFSAARCKILLLCLSTEKTERLVRACRKNRVSINSALGAAMLLAVARNVYGGWAMPFRHFFFANLRPYLNPPLDEEHLGGYHSMMRLTIRLNGSIDYWKLAKDLNRLIYAAAKKGEKFISPLLSPALMRMFIRKQDVRMGATALSYTGIAGLQREYGQTRVNAVHGFVSNFAIGPEFTATARIFDGRLWLDVLYLDGDIDKPRATTIAEELVSAYQTATGRNAAVYLSAPAPGASCESFGAGITMS